MGWLGSPKYFRERERERSSRGYIPLVVQFAGSSGVKSGSFERGAIYVICGVIITEELGGRGHYKRRYPFMTVTEYEQPFQMWPSPNWK